MPYFWLYAFGFTFSIETEQIYSKQKIAHFDYFFFCDMKQNATFTPTISICPEINLSWFWYFIRCTDSSFNIALCIWIGWKRQHKIMCPVREQWEKCVVLLFCTPLSIPPYLYIEHHRIFWLNAEFADDPVFNTVYRPIFRCYFFIANTYKRTASVVSPGSVTQCCDKIVRA